MEYFSNLKAKLIYEFRIPDAAHKDCLKIGEATFEDGDITLQPNSHPLNKAAKARIDQYTKTVGIHYELLHTEIAIFIRDGKLCGMNDKKGGFLNHNGTYTLIKDWKAPKDKQKIRFVDIIK